ncbi:APC family permease [Halomarina pelagica]|uniref:APC family permease n=1 Tax=Halomarina pelagica TaxID=2961599 RepID=UPI0020C405E5|nr:APC family permease [Halomarina sp. BND7]
MAIDTGERRLVRQLGWVHGVTIMAGMMIGAGIFVVTGTAAGIMGPAVPLGFLAVVPLIIATALIYSIYMSGPLGEHAGGAYVHISRTWNSLFAGYIVMWMKWIAYAGSIAAIGLDLGAVLHSFEVLSGLSAQTWTLAAITLLFAINLLGVDIYGNAQALLTIPLVGILLLLVVPGLFVVDGGNFTPLFPQELYGGGYVDPVLAGVAVLLFSYVGFEALAQAGEEMKAPQQTLPKLFVYTSLGVGILYMLVTFVVIGVVGWQAAASAEAPLTAAARAYFPAGTATIVAFASVLAYVTTMNTCYLVPSRLLYAFGKDNVVPSTLAHVNDRFRTPDVSLLITYVVSVVFVLTATFQFAILITLASVTLVYLTHSLSGMVLPWLRPELYERSQFRLSPVACAIVGGVSAVTMAVLGWQTLSVNGIAPAVGMVLRGNVVDGLTSNPALMLFVWGLAGAAIFFGHRAYLRATGTEIEDERSMRRLYDSAE